MGESTAKWKEQDVKKTPAVHHVYADSGKRKTTGRSLRALANFLCLIQPQHPLLSSEDTDVQKSQNLNSGSG